MKVEQVEVEGRIGEVVDKGRKKVEGGRDLSLQMLDLPG